LTFENICYILKKGGLKMVKMILNVIAGIIGAGLTFILAIIVASWF